MEFIILYKSNYEIDFNDSKFQSNVLLNFDRNIKLLSC